MSAPFFPFDPQSLRRHAVLVGQSGSGKTGLLLSMLEEIALARIAVLAIDLKNDLCNLKLVHADPQADDHLPFTDADDARRLGLTPSALAAQTAAAWRAGLHADGLHDLHLWHDRVDVQILTPGSDIAPVDVVSALTAPPPELPVEQRLDWVTGAVASLLTLVDLPSHPVNNDPANLLARIYLDALEAGEALTLDTVLARVVRPPFERLGRFAVDEVLPPKARHTLALKLNNILAAPGFAPWRHGAPFDIDAWLRPTDGKTPVHILSLHHLDDHGRTFFTTLLLHALVAWMRRQPGSAGLRAVFAFDEAFGVLPPQPHDPPTKAPLLTIIKQGRAFGLGLLLATQNPKDIDHRALSNAGTWLSGRLLTEHDRDRVIEGMGGDDRTLHDQLANLPDRHFLWRDPKGQLRVVRSRHTRAWLAGPLTGHHLRFLQGHTPRRVQAPPRYDRVAGPPPMPEGLRAAWLRPSAERLARLQARLPDDPPAWVPALYARFEARIRDDGEEITLTRHRLWLPLDRPPISLRLSDADLHPGPQPGDHALLPAALNTHDELRRWERTVLPELADTFTTRRFVGPGARGALGEPEATVQARHPGVPLTPTQHRPLSRDVRVDWFGVVWIPTTPEESAP